MSKQTVDRDLLVNTVILSNSLMDNIDIMLDNGWFVRDLKSFSKNFCGKLESFTKQVYQGVSDERMVELSKEIDLDIELFKRIHKMSKTDKEQLLTKLN